MAKAEAGTVAETTAMPYIAFLPASPLLASMGVAELTEGWAVPQELEVKFYISSPPNNPGY